ncbi:sensor histidine kinase [Paenibacillus sp. 1001270B_150601_E10]|uniref:sensor histidine kinase n=1 Tax=Paenibacillus sp. 1001270B_150601_E10 TaxID=2787079 RepID=UPI001E5AE6F0|nr:HAMP domain-containing sensor histidine kinase [Paenibacillus sp. 1001270B_150601_E10]
MRERQGRHPESPPTSRHSAKKISKTRRYLKHTLDTLMLLLVLVGVWIAAYYTLQFILSRTEWELSGLALFLVQSGTATVYGAIVLTIFILFAWRKMNYALTQIIDALRRISKGEFNVMIDTEDRIDGEYDKIIAGINDMAVGLQEMEQMRQEFISNVSHEIQSPLTSIRGFALALQEEELTEKERKHYLQIIETETIRLSKLSDNLLKLTSLESEHHVMAVNTYRLDEQIKQVVLASESLWGSKNIELELSLSHATITADEDALSQVWTNLIHNAIKFAKEEGHICIAMKLEADVIQISIADDGIGIAEEHLPHVFERFYKADASRNRKLGGNGLGLSIVKKIVELHRGKVQVESQLGAGSVFIVQLPYQCEVKAAVDAQDSSS